MQQVRVGFVVRGIRDEKKLSGEEIKGGREKCELELSL